MLYAMVVMTLIVIESCGFWELKAKVARLRDDIAEVDREGS